jgi:sigma-E factor negative regulatory protein RseB
MLGGMAAALALAWGTMAGDASAAHETAPPSDPEAMRLLSGTSSAAASTSFEGTEFLSAWFGGSATSSSVGVMHAPGAGTLLHDGGARGGPGAFTVEPEGAPSQSGEGALSRAMVDLLLSNYSVVRAGSAQACGRPATVVEAHRADGSVAARFWIDRDTGVLLSRDVFDSRGRKAISEGFQQFAVTPGQGRPAGFGPLAGSRISMWARATSGSLWGWHAPRELPGRLSLFDARQAGGRGGDAVQLAYSDGISSVSVFVQRGQLDESKYSGWDRASVDGRTVFEKTGQEWLAVWGSGGRVFTVLATAPSATAQAAVAALPHGTDRARGSGFWGRLHRGADRLASWLDPFD